MNAWKTVPVSQLPEGFDRLNTYTPDTTRCFNGHALTSEDDCILPEDETDAWDYFLCRACVEQLNKPKEGCVCCGTTENILWEKGDHELAVATVCRQCKFGACEKCEEEQ